MGDRLVADRALSDWSLQKDRSWGLDGKWMENLFCLLFFLAGKGSGIQGSLKAIDQTSPQTHIYKCDLPSVLGNCQGPEVSACIQV